MFNFTTTTVINKLEDYTTGKALITAEDGILRIKRHNPFVGECCKVFKAEAVEAAPDVLDLSNIATVATESDAVYRLKIYIKSVGNADPFYANSLVFKGKPLYFEFHGGDDAIAELVENAGKYMNSVMDSNIVIFDEDEKTMTCANEYMRISEAVVEQFDSDADKFVALSDLVEDGDLTVGNEGFGTYDHLMKDYRLPTGANLRWKRTMEDEMPAAGAKYDQYTLYYTKERGVMGLGAVGMLATSRTCHVFWVNHDIASQFDAKLTAAGITTQNVKTVDKDASTDEGDAAPVITA